MSCHSHPPLSRLAQSSYQPSICITSSLFSLLAALAFDPWLLSVIYLHHLIVPFDMLHLVSGVNSLFPFDNLVSVSLSPTHIFLDLPLLPLWIHQSHRPLLPHSFIHTYIPRLIGLPICSRFRFRFRFIRIVARRLKITKFTANKQR